MPEITQEMIEEFKERLEKKHFGASQKFGHMTPEHQRQLVKRIEEVDTRAVKEERYREVVRELEGEED